MTNTKRSSRKDIPDSITQERADVLRAIHSVGRSLTTKQLRDLTKGRDIKYSQVLGNFVRDGIVVSKNKRGEGSKYYGLSARGTRIAKALSTIEIKGKRQYAARVKKAQPVAQMPVEEPNLSKAAENATTYFTEVVAQNANYRKTFEDCIRLFQRALNDDIEGGDYE